MSKLKVGDEAFITGAFLTKGNIGKKVRLIEFVPANGSVYYQDGYFDGHVTGCWIVESVSGEMLLRNAEGGVVKSNICACAPSHLAKERSKVSNLGSVIRLRTKFA